MNRQEILSKCDHTILKPEAVWEDVRKICDEAMQYHTASICIPPCYVKRAAEYCDGRMPVCTVIGFRTGTSLPSSKRLRRATRSLSARTRSIW